MAGTVYTNLNCPWWDEEIVKADGTPPAASDDDAAFIDMEPTANTWQTHAVAAQPDVARNYILTITDPNGSLTKVSLELIGTDNKGQGVQETLADVGTPTGSRVLTGKKMFKTITTQRTYTEGTVGAGVDKLKGGYGNALQTPYDIDKTTDITGRQDANAAVGTFDPDYQSWTLSGGNVPNGVRRFFTTGRSTVGE